MAEQSTEAGQKDKEWGISGEGKFAGSAQKGKRPELRVESGGRGLFGQDYTLD